MTDLLPDTATTDDPSSDNNRRPIKSRGNRLVRKLAARLLAAGVTPNQISQASVLCAAVGLACLWLGSLTTSWLQSLLLLLAALCMQLRLLCNLLDGLVAVEGGQGDATGAFWNEAPDRVADLLLFWGAGLLAGHAALGLICAALAIGCAYLRELGRAEGFAPDFSGPMAKPHRMAALTVAALAAALLPIAQSAATLMTLALWLILLGLGATLARRARRLLQALERRGSPKA